MTLNMKRVQWWAYDPKWKIYLKNVPLKSVEIYITILCKQFHESPSSYSHKSVTGKAGKSNIQFEDKQQQGPQVQDSTLFQWKLKEFEMDGKCSFKAINPKVKFLFWVTQSTY